MHAGRHLSWAGQSNGSEDLSAVCEPCITGCGRLAPSSSGLEPGFARGALAAGDLRPGQAMTCSSGFCVPLDRESEFVAACGGAQGGQDPEEDGDVGVSRIGRRLLMQVKLFASVLLMSSP
jgi:hypothetical protein